MPINRKYQVKYSDLSDVERFKASARAKAKMAVRRGVIIKKRCEVCGEEKVEMHHDDYSRPYDVRFLCLKHHREWHSQNKPKEIVDFQYKPRALNNPSFRDLLNKALLIVKAENIELPKSEILKIVTQVLDPKNQES